MIKRIIFISFITATAAFIVLYFNQMEPIKNEQLFEFPLQIGQWNGVDVPMEDRIFESLETPYAILKNYTNDQNIKINFVIVWYDDKEIAFHSAAACLGGLGDRVKEDTTYNFQLDNGQNINVGRIVTEKFLSQYLVLYYYINDGYITGNQIDLRRNVIKKRLMFQRTSAAFVRIMMPVTGSQENSEQLIEDFLELTLPLVDKYTASDFT